MNAMLKAAALALIVTTPAHAQQFGDGRMGLGLGVSTLGVTGDISYELDPRLQVRFLAGTMRFSESDTFEEGDSQGDFDATFRAFGIGPVIDYHPFENGWRLSGGALFSEYRLSAEVTGGLSIDGEDYENADVRARVRTRNRIMPKLAVGYSGSNLFGSRFGLSVDAGVLYAGGLRTRVRDRNNEVPDDDLAKLRGDIDDAIRDNLGAVRVLPYVSAGLRMNF